MSTGSWSNPTHYNSIKTIIAIYIPEQAINTTRGKTIMNRVLAPGPNPTQFIILFSVLALLLIHHADAQGDPIAETNQFPCYSTDSYAPGSSFETNLKTLLSFLVSSSSQEGFFKTSIGVAPNTVYGLVQCRGDISQDSCRSCLYNSSVELIKRCPSRRVATLRYDHCILRYSDTQFFSQVDRAARNEYNPVQVSDADATRFSEQLRSLLTYVSTVAAARQNRYGYGYADYTRLEKRVYGLVQCNEDLSPANCKSCVQSLMAKIPVCCDKRIAAKIFSATCYLRYEQQDFAFSATAKRT